ncbi:MAG: sel1 repeat family protein [Candidatus Methanomethylophilaceae archaeon]|nr:sel1 repeat family protein [Candidatus Methanomethylophilaceae archaeon]
MYEHGEGTEQSYDKAAEWYAKAAGQNALAKYHLGCLYEAGKGVPRSVDKAKELYADSAEWENEGARRSILRVDPNWKEEYRR